MDEICTAEKKYGNLGDPTRGQDSIGGRPRGKGERDGNVTRYVALPHTMHVDRSFS
jgi:hypothetical protein